MTPKEKAKELYQKMSYWQMVDGGTRQIEAKQCALIAVDEIISYVEYLSEPHWMHQDYWIEVKHEINLL